jgi:hypothetical protein
MAFEWVLFGTLFFCFLVEDAFDLPPFLADLDADLDTDLETDLYADFDADLETDSFPRFFFSTDTLIVFVCLAGVSFLALG